MTRSVVGWFLYLFILWSVFRWLVLFVSLFWFGMIMCVMLGVMWDMIVVLSFLSRCSTCVRERNWSYSSFCMMVMYLRGKGFSGFGGFFVFMWFIWFYILCCFWMVLMFLLRVEMIFVFILTSSFRSFSLLMIMMIFFVFFCFFVCNIDDVLFLK